MAGYSNTSVSDVGEDAEGGAERHERSGGKINERRGQEKRRLEENKQYER